MQERVQPGDGRYGDRLTDTPAPVGAHVEIGTAAERVQGVVHGYARDYMTDTPAIVVRVAPGLVVWVPLVAGIVVVQVKPKP